MTSKIEWTDETWNFIGGCAKTSPGCANCYALRDSWRIMHNPKAPARYDDVCGVGPGGVEWTGRLNFDFKALDLPLRWQKPRRVFVCSMSDLFHQKVPNWVIEKAMETMAIASNHTFQILTKRPKRMMEAQSSIFARPLPNVWCGTTIELSEYSWRKEYLRRTPAAVRFVSFEPLLETMCTHPGVLDGIDWAIIGCESGSRRRPMELEWAIDLVRQCRAAGVACFVKQIPINGRVSKDPAEWPAELRVREYPS